MAESGSGNTARRDQLVSIQEKLQQKWAEEKVFEADAKETGPGPGEKFFGNFPYPYMNGVLHLGHAYSISKLEIVSAFHRICGKNVLFPQGFHCTGMPIKACADRLRGEIEQYGNPPQFPADEEEVAPAPEPVTEAAPVDPTQFKATKGKAAAKKGKGATQWDILKNSGIPENEIHEFQDPLHWLRYFPPLAKRDLTALGCGIDWRRSFITTAVNPYYDSFVRWQLQLLKDQGKVIKDKRFTVFSPKDGQPCADHDRASGEGVNPQEYTLVKMKVLELRGPLAALEGKGPVFLMAATLRPETMYGQTNCWVLPSGQYGAFEGLGGEIFVMCERAARNLAFQDKTPTPGELSCLATFTGQDLIGTPLCAPRAIHERIYVLPLLTILMTKGTGVVTSVPSDSPTDFIALQDLKRKAGLREKFGVQDEWVLPFEVVPIIHIPDFGDKAAEKVVSDLKIQSQNDEAKLEEAKKLVYLAGFTDGVMTVGAHAGTKVAEAKPLIRQELLESGEATLYSEPEGRVMSRSGDECVVALTDQWYITYGEASWRATTEACLEGMELYDETVRNGFRSTLGWLNQWACSRSFGLGTRLPWDPEFLIESLSDSTIYMAFYTVAHILQGDNMYGEGESSVRAEDMTPGVWDAILLGKPVPEGCAVAGDLLDKMRMEFSYWYPFDLRVSGKDLIQNHLTFCLYNHTAIWPTAQWPKAMRTNGHLLLNSDKMSKSTGNFLTLRQAIQRYSADATRMALADASDSNDDGNFEEKAANSAILRLTKELVFFQELVAAGAPLATRTGPLTLIDRVFENAIRYAAFDTHTAYTGMLLRGALKAGMFDLQTARDVYRNTVGAEGMHADVMKLYMHVAVRIQAPICPHWCDYVHRELLGGEGSVLVAGWPNVDAPDPGLRLAGAFVERLITRVRTAVEKKQMPPKKKKDSGPPLKVKGVTMYVCSAFTGWRATALRALRECYDATCQDFADNWNSITVDAVKGEPELASLNEKMVKAAVLPFVKFKMQEAKSGGKELLDTSPPFDEVEVVNEYLEHIKRCVGIDNIEVRAVDGGSDMSKETALPLEPRLDLHCD